jgi:hypothetical protein
MRYAMLTEPERLPDLLRERVGTYFERDGLCLAPMFETTPAGECVMALYFQNRYAGTAQARVRVSPPRRALWLTRHRLPTPTFAFDCPGGAFGVARTAFPIPAKYQGRRMTFRVSADVTYPHGLGELLRIRTGAAPRRWTATLPQGVAECSISKNPITLDLIWWPALLERRTSLAA